jgi:hypothetical protein
VLIASSKTSRLIPLSRSKKSSNARISLFIGGMVAKDEKKWAVHPLSLFDQLAKVLF